MIALFVKNTGLATICSRSIKEGFDSKKSREGGKEIDSIYMMSHVVTFHWKADEGLKVYKGMTF